MIYGQLFRFQKVFCPCPLLDLTRPEIDDIPGQRKKQSPPQSVRSLQDLIF